MKVVIAARTAPTSHGGLAHYQLALADALVVRDFQVNFVSAVGDWRTKADVEDNNTVGGYPQILSGEPRLMRSWVWTRLATRPRYHALLEGLIAGYYRKRLQGLEQGNACAVHYVGTGWDMFGIGIQRFCENRGIPLSILPAVHPFSWGDDIIDLRLYRRAKSIVVLSRSEGKYLEKLGISNNAIVQCGLAPACRLDGDGKRLRDSLGLGMRPVALFIARREAAKGFDALVVAWPIVLASVPTACLLIIGPESSGKPVLQLLEPESIRDLGMASEKTKANALDACDVLCVPSAHESFGIVYVEAWAYGKPVICGTATAARELVEDGQNGLWSSQDPTELAEALIRVLSDRPLAEKMGAVGKEVQHKYYTWDKVAERHIDMLGWK